MVSQWGSGWKYITLSAELSAPQDVWWHGYPYSREIYRYAGWPFYSLQSRVITTGKYGSMPYRWNLQSSEILWRGLNTDDLPKWMGAYPQRRLALVPIAWGFVGNTLLYALLLGRRGFGA